MLNSNVTLHYNIMPLEKCFINLNYKLLADVNVMLGYTVILCYNVECYTITYNVTTLSYDSELVM